MPLKCQAATVHQVIVQLVLNAALINIFDIDSFIHSFQDKEPRGIIPLENLSIREVEDPRKPVRLPFCELFWQICHTFSLSGD